MKVIVLLICLLPAALCWEYPGYPGVDCPTARKQMILKQKIFEDVEEETRWMIPKCQDDGTFQDLQCYTNVGTCMCCAPDGQPLTLPVFGLHIESCVCLMAQYRVFEHDHSAELPKCEKNGYFAPLQCSEISKKCWCVDRNGNVLVPPSTEVHSCENDAY